MKDFDTKEEFYSSKNTTIVNKYTSPTKDFVVIDLETTGRERDAKITQISAIKIIDDIIVDKFNYLINPERLIPENIVFLTGITNEMVKNKPTIDQVMPKFMEFVKDNVIIGHNIRSFDINVLVRNGFCLPSIDIIDTLHLCRNCEFEDEIVNHKLPTLKKYFGINAPSHNAFEDCKTNMIIYQKLRDKNLKKVEIVKVKCSQNLSDLRFVVTGEFMGISRDDITEIIKAHGGKVTSAVSNKTDYLIVGKQVDPRLKTDKSSKQIKAETLLQNGSKIQIIDYDKFENMINK